MWSHSNWKMKSCFLTWWLFESMVVIFLGKISRILLVVNWGRYSLQIYTLWWWWCVDGSISGIFCLKAANFQNSIMNIAVRLDSVSHCSWKNVFFFGFLHPLTFFGNYRFSQVHEFEKPNDETALNLMNSCSAAVLEEFPDIIFAYGYSDEYRSPKLALLTLFVLHFSLLLIPVYIMYKLLIVFHVFFSFVFKKTSRFYQRRARYVFY